MRPIPPHAKGDYYPLTATTEVTWDDPDGRWYRTTYRDGTVIQTRNDLPHGQPARISPDGTTEYFENGQRHRDNGPAVIYPDGSMEWWVNGEQVRTVGPPPMPQGQTPSPGPVMFQHLKPSPHIEVD